MKHPSIKKLIVFIAAIFIFITASVSMPVTSLPTKIKAAQVSEDNEQIKVGNLIISFDYGLEKCVKYSRDMGFVAEIKNDGEIFYGDLQVLLPDFEGNSTLYQQEIIVEAGSTKKVALTIPLGVEDTALDVKIINNKQKTIVEKEYQLDAYNYGKMVFVGILSEEPEKLSYFEKFGTKIFALNKDSLPEDASLLEQLDVLVIDHFNTAILSENQIEAMKRWVLDGGSIVIGTGEYAKDTLAGINKELFDITIAGDSKKTFCYAVDQAEVDRLKQKVLIHEEERKGFLESLSLTKEKVIDTTSSLFAFDYLQKSSLDDINMDEWKPVAVKRETVELTLENAKEIVHDKDQAHMQIVLSGSGNIQIFPFQLGLIDKSNQVMETSILFTVLDHLSETKLLQLENEHYGSAMDYRIINGTSYTDTKNIPTVGKYIVILVIYVIIVGPVLYLILKKKDKRNLTWVLVPVIAFIFTMIVYFMGSTTRIDEPYIGFVNILNLDDQEAEEKVFFSITAPYNQKYDVKVNQKYNVNVLKNGKSNVTYYLDRASKKQNKLDSENYKTAILQSKDRETLEIKDYPAFTPCYFESQYNYSYPYELKNNIDFTEFGLQGTIENGLGYDLDHAILLRDGFLVNMSTFLNNDVASIEGKESEFLQSSSSLYNSNILGNTTTTKTDSVEEKKRDLLEYFVEKYMLSGDRNSYLVGFTEMSGKESIISSLSQYLACNGITMVVTPIATEDIESKTTWVPNIDFYMDLVEGSYDNTYSFRFMESQTLVARYDLPDDENILSFHYLPTMNLTYNHDYANGFVGEIYFYNYKSETYDLVFDTLQRVMVKDPSRYLDGNNQLLVKYQINQAYEGSYMSLPYISYQKEAK